MATRLLSAVSLFLLAACSGLSPLHAQHAFTISIPSLEAAGSRPMVQTPDGGFVIFFSRAFYDQTEESYEADSSFFGLAKLSSDGLIEWSRYVTLGSRHTKPVALLQTDDGGFIAMGNVYDGESPHQDIAFLRFNAHGYLLSTRSYDIGVTDQVTDAIRLENGNVMIAGSTKWNQEEDGPEVEALTLILDQQGEIVKGNRYPALLDYWYGEFKLRPLNAGTIALIGSIYDTALYRSPGLVCMVDPEGAVQRTLLVNPSRYFDGTSISDIIVNRKGDYSLIGNIATYDCGGPFYEGFMFSCNPNGDTLWARNFANDQSVSLDRFLPSGGDAYSMVGGIRNYGDPEYVVKSLNEVGGIRQATAVSPYAVEATNELEYPAEHMAPESGYLQVSDGGIAITNSKFSNLYDEEYNWLGAKRELRVTRLSPDLLPCNGASRSVQTDGNGLKFYREEEYEAAFGEIVVEPIEGTASGDKVVEGASDEVAYDATEYASEEDPSETYVVEENVSEEYEAKDVNALEDSEPEEESVPFISTLEVTPGQIEVSVRNVIDHKTLDLELDPQVLCRENMMATSSAADHGSVSDAPVTAEILLSPNSIRKGESTGISFTLSGRTAPEITLLTIATGEVIRRIEGSATNWSSVTGHGSATIETDDIATGIYLVRVRSGERQLTAKLEIR